MNRTHSWLFALLCLPTATLACSCLPGPSVEERVASSTEIFVAQVVTVDYENDRAALGNQRATYRVLTELAGSAARHPTLWSQVNFPELGDDDFAPTSCDGSGFIAGASYLLMLSRPEDAVLRSCNWRVHLIRSDFELVRRVQERLPP